MDPFALILLCSFVGVILFVLAIGKFAPGTGVENVGLRSARQITETREALEAEDLDQMMRAHNRRRAARGQGEITVSDFELRVAEDVREQRRLSSEYLAERDLDQLLDAVNERRRRRGLPERTREQAREEFDRKPTSEG